MWVKPEKDKTSYTIEASVERQPAEDVKIIAFLKPIDNGEKTDDLKILHEYPTVVRFCRRTTLN